MWYIYRTTVNIKRNQLCFSMWMEVKRRKFYRNYEQQHRSWYLGKTSSAWATVLEFQHLLILYQSNCGSKWVNHLNVALKIFILWFKYLYLCFQLSKITGSSQKLLMVINIKMLGIERRWHLFLLLSLVKSHTHSIEWLLKTGRQLNSQCAVSWSPGPHFFQA